MLQAANDRGRRASGFNGLRALGALCLLWLAGCASGPTAVDPTTPAASTGSAAGATPAVTAPPPAGSGSVPAPAGSAAIDALLDESRQLRAGGDLNGCFARLDRALRIAPQRADIYLELALCHREARRDDRAAAAAQRGLLYCSGSLCRELRRFSDS